ncbi:MULTISPECIES: restriction endonuclease [Providencia]|uniref:restriction endonuclease n=1 Tax=Providencia TaxID=586 RepID=UPI00234ABA49|nr:MULTISPECIES: restriction endonuclease [unclassified Providencia]MCK9788912.1 restriction endonuclease [Providencia rettgeri]MDX7422521.1 restriction endonuclease [Providencia sp. CIM-Carb-044]
MGAILFKKHELANHLHEIIGYKSGLAASIEEICDLLQGSGFDKYVHSSESHPIRIRSEEYDSLYYTLLHKIGVTDKPFGGIFETFKTMREIEHKNGADFAHSINQIFYKHIDLEIKKAITEGAKSLNPEGMMTEASKTFGKAGLDAIVQLLISYDNMMKHSPNTKIKFHQYRDIINLSDLFKQYNPIANSGAFLDQRFIDFLSNNIEKLGEIHWRKFEELTAECFQRFGYTVELGPGSNDDGVDLRVWNKTSIGAPNYIIQCKRINKKIDKVTVKGLYTDILHEGSELGILVTSSEFSVGARSTIEARSYPIEEVNRDNIAQWLKKLRTPGTGIVRV